MRSRTRRVLVPLAAGLLVAAAACGKPAPRSARPQPSPRGAPIGQSSSPIVIGPAGGTFTSSDTPPTLIVTVPANAVAAPVDFTVVPITSTAPGSVGTEAYRLAPDGTVFLTPITLEFLVKDAALDLNALTVAVQDGSGYWVRYHDVERDLAARTLRVTSTHLSDWAIVTGTSARDLRGSFTLTTTTGVPLAAAGAAFLDYAGEDGQKVYYLLWGDITLSSAPITIDASTCTPDLPTVPLPTNVAEVTKAPARFDWGVSGHWNLACTSGGLPAPAQVLTVAFDTVGVSLTGCARSYAGTPVVGADHVASGGDYLVTCGQPPPAQTATWDFGNGACGSSCITHPDLQCHTGVVDCSSGVATCVDGIALVDGTPCNDGDACTLADTCQAGACTGADPVVCVAPDQCHDAGVCDPATGVCFSTAKLDGTACSDGDACTLADTCQAGVCTGADPVVCTAQDQCHDTGVCDPATGVCSSPAKLDGTTCNDGNACTLTDTCQAGSCAGADPVVCTAQDQCHDAGTCDTATGVCSSPAKVDGAACNDGNACTLTDTCQAGVCSGASPVVCTAQDECHDAGTCDTAAGICSNPTRPDGTVCTGGACLGGVCARTVTGQRLVTYWTDAGPQAPVAPADVAPTAPLMATVTAYAPDASGRAFPGTLDVLGNYSIPGVPVGSYLLVVTDGAGTVHATQTSASSVDLGWDVLGRPDATPAAPGTLVTVAVTGLDSWDTLAGAADQIQLTSADAGVWDPAIRGTQILSTSGSVVEDWGASAAGGPLALLAPSDVLWAAHLAKATTAGAPAFDYRTATFAMSPPSVDLSGVPPFTLPLDFPVGSTVPQSGSVNVASWDLPAFEAFLSAMAPQPNAPGGTAPGPVHSLRVAASIHALASPAPVPRNGTPDLLLLQVPVPAAPGASGVITSLGVMPYGQFLPVKWLEWVGVDLTATQSYLLPPATDPLVERVSLGHRQALLASSPLALAPALSPATGVQLSLGPVPTVSWAAPALGAPTSYTVDLYLLQAAGASTTSTRVATFATGPGAAGLQGIAIPPGVLVTGRTYYARITAHAGVPDPFDTQPLRRANVGTWASALSVTFTP